MLMILKITLASLIFVNLGAVTDQIPRWLNAAFNQPNLDEFHQIESTVRTIEVVFVIARTNGRDTGPMPKQKVLKVHIGFMVRLRVSVVST